MAAPQATSDHDTGGPDDGGQIMKNEPRVMRSSSAPNRRSNARSALSPVQPGISKTMPQKRSLRPRMRNVPPAAEEATVNSSFPRRSNKRLPACKGTLASAPLSFTEGVQERTRTQNVTRQRKRKPTANEPIQTSDTNGKACVFGYNTQRMRIKNTWKDLSRSLCAVRSKSNPIVLPPPPKKPNGKLKM